MSFVVREANIPILPLGHRPIRILHFSDLHLTPRNKAKIADIKSFAALEPDLVIATGDFLAHQGAVPTTLGALGELLDFPGLFVFGSNDYFAPRFKNPLAYLTPDNGKRVEGVPLPWRKLEEGLSQRGWRNLNSSRTLIEIAGTKIEARGTDDAHLNRDNYPSVAGEADPSAEIAIGVTHAPYLRLISAMTKDKLDLIFAGHTHGGQIRAPWFGGSRALVTNCDLPRWRARGLTKLAGEPWLHVSAGMGTSPFSPFRLASPPEVSLLHLLPKEAPEI